MILQNNLQVHPATKAQRSEVSMYDEKKNKIKTNYKDWFDFTI